MSLPSRDKILLECLKHQYGHEFCYLSHLYCIRSPVLFFQHCVDEMAYSLSQSCDSTSKILCHTPVLTQRLKRVCATLKPPKRYGKSRYGIPERYRYNTASTNNLLSLAVTPTVLARPGKQILNLFPLIIS